MQELHLVGFTTDRRRLIFSARQGAKSGSFVVPVDDALLEAVEDLRAGALDEAIDDADDAEETPVAPPPELRAEAKLSVREVQARLRAGDSIGDVAKRAAVDDAWVERFAPPVRAEQRRVVERALSHRLVRRSGTSAVPLRRAVASAMADRGVSFTAEGFEAAWSSRMVGQDRWVVEFAYVQRGRSRIVSFDFDLAEDRLTTSDRTASQLGYVADDAPLPPPATTPGSASTGLSRATSTSSRRPGASATPKKKATAKKPAPAKRPTPRKKAGAPDATAAKKAAARKKNAAAKKVAARKKAAAAKKQAAVEKSAARKRDAVAKKAAAKKRAAAQKAAAVKKSVAAKKSAAVKKSAAAKKSAPRKTAAKKSAPRKAAAKKAAAVDKAAPRKTAGKEKAAPTRPGSDQTSMSTPPARGPTAAAPPDGEPNRHARSAPEAAAAETVAPTDSGTPYAGKHVAAPTPTRVPVRSTPAKPAPARGTGSPGPTTPPSADGPVRRISTAVHRHTDPEGGSEGPPERAAERNAPTAQFRSGSAHQAGAAARDNGSPTLRPDGSRPNRPNGVRPRRDRQLRAR